MSDIFNIELDTMPVDTETVDEKPGLAPFVSSPKNTVEASVGAQGDQIRVKPTILDRLKGIKPSKGKFVRISPIHGRDMTLEATSKSLVWGGDLPGDVYGDQTIKGTVMNSVNGIGIRGIKHEGTRVYASNIYVDGLMDNRSLNRITAVSEYMREHGLPTERPVRVDELKEVWVKTENNDIVKMPIEKWKQLELAKFKEIADNKLEGASELYTQIQDYFNERKFVALTRESQVAERLDDLGIAAKTGKLKEILEPVFKWLNVATEVKNSSLISNTQKPETFSLDNDGMQRYFTEWLPKQMGTYLGRFHAIGLSHHSLHGGNWSAVGTIYDLSSVSGVDLKLGDSAPTEEHFMNDLIDTIDDINKLICVEMKTTKEFADQDSDHMAVQACEGFIRSYFIERFKVLTPEGIQAVSDSFLTRHIDNQQNIRTAIDNIIKSFAGIET